MNIQSWKKFLFVTIALLFSGVLTACSGGGGNESGGSNEEGAVELSVWKAEDVGRADFQVYMDIVEKFNEEHPNINLQVETTVHDDYRTRLNTQAAGGQLPDVFQVWPGAELQPLVDGGAVQPIDEITSYWTEETGYLKESAFDDFTFDGKTYAVPANSNPTHFVFYDKDMLAEAGYDTFPETYDEFLSLIQDLNESGTTPIALGNSGGWVLQSVYLSTIADRFTGSDFLEQVFAGERQFTDPEFVDALGVIDDLVQNNAFNEDFNTIDNIQMIDYFNQGRAAMVIDGNWGLSSILENAPEDKNIGVATIPLGDTNSISTVAGTSMAINSELSGEKLEAAHTFLKYVYNEELWQGLLAVGRPIIAQNIEMPEDANIDPLTQEMIKLASEAPAAPVYDATLSPGLNTVVENELQSISIGRATPEEAAQNIQTALENE